MTIMTGKVFDTNRCAIFTKYLGPTNTRGGRIKAWAKSGGKLSVTIPYPHELNLSDAHASAAIALCDKLDWPFSKLHQAHVENGCVFVMGW